MRDKWSDYERAAQHGPAPIFTKVLLFLLLAGVPLAGIGYVLGWFGEAAAVVQEEFGPREALRKYSWFKDAAAALDEKRANIAVYEQRLTQLEQAYTGTPRGQWPRDEREQYSVWASECSGVRASFNSLAAEYNAQMAKFHWRFAEVGGLPQGAADPLPREFKPYVTQ